MTCTLRVEMIEEDGRVVEVVARPRGAVRRACSPATTRAGSSASTSTRYGFVASPDPKLDATLTSLPGVVAAGTAIGPKDIVDTIVEASAAATKVAAYLGPPAAARPTRRGLDVERRSSRELAVAGPSWPPMASTDGAWMPEREPRDRLDGSRPAERIGVYVCHCGGNISDVVDVDRVATEAAGLEGVAVARHIMFMCSDEGQKAIVEDIAELGLDRVVVAACTPKLHETTFRRAVSPRRA